MSRKIDGRDLFERFANPEETFDEDWLQGMQETIRIDGGRVGKQEWDSGGPGARAGISCVYLLGIFFSRRTRPVCLVHSASSLKLRRPLASWASMKRQQVSGWLLNIELKQKKR
jgi:hypothetical protein